MKLLIEIVTFVATNDAMKIEDEIKQQKFKDEYQKLFINLIFTSNWLYDQHSRFFKKFGITPQQYNVLRILNGQYPKPASVGMVLERMLDKSSNITRLVDKLAMKNLVNRCENKENRRMQDLTITQEGIDFLKICQPEKDVTSASTQKLTKEEAMIINNLLDKMRS
jgi:DNA-binding MarR family transcriptional regulator